MSIVALKKKSRRYIDPISKGGNFSLNGGHRSVGVVGITNLGLYTNKYGATCCTSNDSTIIKSSTMNTKGMLARKFVNCNNNCPKNWVQPITPIDLEQGQYIKIKSHQISGYKINNIPNIKSSCDTDCKVKIKNDYHKNAKCAISSSEYMKGKFMKKNCLPTPKCKQHFPSGKIQSQCKTNVLNADAAKSAGLLPSNWMNCTDPC